jgi:hypothetical protein
LQKFKTSSQIREDQIRAAGTQWKKVLLLVGEKELPPESSLPSDVERKMMVQWLTEGQRLIG